MKSPLTCDYSGNVLRGLAKWDFFLANLFVTAELLNVFFMGN